MQILRVLEDSKKASKILPCRGDSLLERMSGMHFIFAAFLPVAQESVVGHDHPQEGHLLAMQSAIYLLCNLNTSRSWHGWSSCLSSFLKVITWSHV